MYCNTPISQSSIRRAAQAKSRSGEAVITLAPATQIQPPTPDTVAAPAPSAVNTPRATAASGAMAATSIVSPSSDSTGAVLRTRP